MKLDNVTLVCIDDEHPETAHELLHDLNKSIFFKSSKLFCSEFKGKYSTYISPVRSGKDYSEFVIKDLYKHLDTDFCMIVQTDGFFVNPEAWIDDFLNYDYIGAPWRGGGVGNGGFSIRSRSLLKFVSKHPLSSDPEFINGKGMHPEDGRICDDYRPDLEASGYTFAPTDIARKFSVEGHILVTKEKSVDSYEKFSFCLLDWRQDFAGNLNYGDIYYDLAKLNHGLIISHEIINKNLFEISKTGDTVTYEFFRKQSIVRCQDYFIKWIELKGYDLHKVNILTALVFINNSPLHHFPYNLLLFYQGKSMLADSLNISI